MAARSQSGKPPRRKRPAKKAEGMSKEEREDLELAEEILRAGREDAAELAAAFTKILRQLGFKGKPMGAKKLREQLIKRGFDPNSNEFSRGIIEMREE
jgi:hypothetical protein